jgi:hypothetical protein
VVFVFDTRVERADAQQTQNSKRENTNQSRTATRSRVLECEKDDDERL